MEDGIEQPSNFLAAGAVCCFAGSLLMRCFFRSWFQKQSEQAYVLMLVGCVIVGGACGYICLNHHFCMAGHFQHPPYRLTAYINDVIWMLGFVWAAILVFSAGIKFRFAFVFSGAIAIVFLGTAINLDLLFLFPAWLFCVAFTFACWLDWID